MKAGVSGSAIAHPPRSLGEWLTDILKDRLTKGGYQPGEWIREAALQREFGLSNGPVREALQNLVSIGVLVREARRGVRVVELTDAKIIELFQVRLALLELATEFHAVRNPRRQDLASGWTLVEAVERGVRQADPELLVWAGGALVDWVCETCGNQQLLEAWQQLTLKSRVYISASLRACCDLESLGLLWRSLVEAIASGQVATARAAARGMVRRNLEDLGLEPGF